MIPEDPLTEPVPDDPLMEPTTQPIPEPATKPTAKPVEDDEANAKKSAIGGILAALQQHEEEPEETPEEEPEEGGEHTYEDDDTSHETGTPIERPLTESPVETIDDGNESKPYDAQGEDDVLMAADENGGISNAYNDPVYSGDPVDMSTLMVADDGTVMVGGQEV